MKLMTRLSLILALFSAPLSAASIRVEAIDAAPQALAPASAVSPAAGLVAAPLTASPLVSAPLAAAPAASVAPALAPSPIQAAAPAAAPVAARATAPVAAKATAPVAAKATAALPATATLPATAAAADGPKRAATAAPAAAAPEDAGRELFDQSAPARPLADVVKEHSGRALRNGVFIQQEHEGSLLAPDTRDSSGNVFRYYRPVEIRPELAAQVDVGLTGFSRFVYNVRRFFQLSGRKAPDAAWRAWPLGSKLDYLDRLEAAVTKERGPAAAWDGKVSLIMERKDEAPDFVTKHPHMEPPPDALSRNRGAKYLQPEIVSDKNHPAGSVSQALGRARMIIGDTGHAGVQFHVFVKAEPKALLAQMDSLDGALQLVNDVLFAQAAAGSDANITHASLMPWHRGRSERVRELLMKAEKDPHVPAAGDQDSEKHAFVGFRYWGMEDGKAVVSLELRGASLPWKRSSRAVKMEDTSLPKRDYESAQAYLTILSLYAEALAAGRAPIVPLASSVIDEAGAERVLRARAEEMGMPESAYDGLAAFGRRMIGAKATPAGYLFPFAASAPDSPELRAYAGELLVLAARVKASEEAGHAADQLPHYRYLFWSAYQDWAGRFGARQNARLSALIRSVDR